MLRPVWRSRGGRVLDDDDLVASFMASSSNTEPYSELSLYKQWTICSYRAEIFRRRMALGSSRGRNTSSTRDASHESATGAIMSLATAFATTATVAQPSDGNLGSQSSTAPQKQVSDFITI